MYPFCLPLEYAAYNLFHEIRDDALVTFKHHDIIWHGSALSGLPTNQCSNAGSLRYRFSDSANFYFTATGIYCFNTARARKPSRLMLPRREKPDGFLQSKRSASPEPKAARKIPPSASSSGRESQRAAY